jgi:NADH dehydrogenase
MLSFVVVGAGPTGVEMAGQIAELARDTLRRDFRAVNSVEAQVELIEAAERPLPSFPPVLSAKAARSLQKLGVTVRLNRAVIGVDRHGVTIQSPDGSTERVAARTVIWAAGVEASPLARELARQSGAELDRAGRLTVESDLTISGHPEVIALGDMVRVRTTTGETQTLPGVAPVAIQQGRYAGRLVLDRQGGRSRRPFRYRDKGNLATIGRARAVADLRLIRLTGLLAWLVWLVIHLWYLIGFQNRVLVMTRWGFSFITRGRGARLITDGQPSGRQWPEARDVHAAGVES